MGGCPAYVPVLHDLRDAETKNGAAFPCRPIGSFSVRSRGGSNPTKSKDIEFSLLSDSA